MFPRGPISFRKLQWGHTQFRPQDTRHVDGVASSLLNQVLHWKRYPLGHLSNCRNNGRVNYIQDQAGSLRKSTRYLQDGYARGWWVHQACKVLLHKPKSYRLGLLDKQKARPNAWKAYWKIKFWVQVHFWVQLLGFLRLFYKWID